jgi:hypothetical protein
VRLSERTKEIDEVSTSVDENRLCTADTDRMGQSYQGSITTLILVNRFYQSKCWQAETSNIF